VPRKNRKAKSVRIKRKSAVSPKRIAVMAPPDLPQSIAPTNLSAQLAYQGIGNPPCTHPRQAISNCFPGLESDFRNVWRRIFVGIRLHEAENIVVAVEDDAPGNLRHLLNSVLLSVDGQQVVTQVVGPPQSSRPNEPFPEPERPVDTLERNAALEWSNALAHIVRKAGGKVRCRFEHPTGGKQFEQELEVRSFFDASPVDGKRVAPRAVISRELAEAGDLTQSLCSPWLDDYHECACYYWAASRPDYVNVEPGSDGTSIGHNWLDRERSPRKEYSLRDDDLHSKDDLFQRWEQLLKFQIRGKDSEE
jgi:hypothetical protein